jgi:hypothetical protein
MVMLPVRDCTFERAGASRRQFRQRVAGQGQPAARRAGKDKLFWSDRGLLDAVNFRYDSPVRASG